MPNVGIGCLNNSSRETRRQVGSSRPRPGLRTFPHRMDYDKFMAQKFRRFSSTTATAVRQPASSPSDSTARSTRSTSRPCRSPRSPCRPGPRAPLAPASAGRSDSRVRQARVMEALIDAGPREGNVLLVSHGGVGHVIEATIRGIDPASFYGLAAISMQK